MRTATQTPFERMTTSTSTALWNDSTDPDEFPWESRIDEPVARATLEELSTLSEFRRAYEPDGMRAEAFEDFGASRHTLRQFLDADAQLDALVRDFVVGAP